MKRFHQGDRWRRACGALAARLCLAGVGGALGCGPAPLDHGPRAAAPAAPTLRSPVQGRCAAALHAGFVSVRLDVASLAAGQSATSKPQRVLAVLSGQQFWQRKQIYVDSQNLAEAFLDWPYLSAAQPYRLQACVDDNEDGLCQEPVVAATLRPTAGVPGQLMRLDIARLQLLPAARATLNQVGPKPRRLNLRLSTAPDFNPQDKRSPWYAGEHLLPLAAMRVSPARPGTDATTEPLDETTLAPAFGVASYGLLTGAMRPGEPYRVQLSMCSFLDRPCTQTIDLRAAHKDLDLALPALPFAAAALPPISASL